MVKDLPIDGRRVLPHRPPMLLVSTLDVREGERAIATAIVPDGGLCVEKGYALHEYFIELIAQTAGAASGYDSLLAGKDGPEGMLVGIDNYTVLERVSPGDHLSILTERQFHFGPVSVISGEVRCGDVMIAEGVIKVWERPEGADEGE